ncbi:MAG: AAA family ATPase, partial [Chlorobi bacterium]|nr:AAA family ATPase [Chlorobiota bacterium]
KKYMYLSKLELIGFKSFAQKTVIKFNGGMTAIVGPNGCGKTNIVDAIRWALGEQKSAVLRSDLMENVIFNGTTKRKPLGMAEVSLTLLNNKNVLPTEYNEVAVSRRLYRSGESKYLINNTKCRLRDVTDLFIDTGLGADSYSVIELKMIEAILSGKPEERRNLFEEAAGVKKYKLRRKEASRRLSSVQSDLVRVRDIAEEVRKNVNTLARQAAKTKRYNKLYEELKKLEIDLLIHEYDLYKNQSDSINLEIEEINNKKVFSEKELADDEASVAELKLALQTLEEKYRDALAEETRIKTEEAQKNKDIAVSEQKTESLKYALERIKREIEEAERNIQKLISDIEKTDNDIVLLIAEKELIEKEFSAIRKERDGLKSEVDSLRQEANSVNEEVLN